MAVMVLSVLSTLVLCMVLLPAVWGVTYSCTSYWDHDDFYHDTKQCGSQYCCGNCNKKYCCREKKYQLTQQKQEQCPARRKVSIAIILGAIFGSIFALIPCVALVICCVTPCCLIHRKFQERHNQREQNLITIVNVPQRPLPTSGVQVSFPEYQWVPVEPGFGEPPLPTAPPLSYLEATDPAHFPAPFSQGHPMYPLQPPGQPIASSPHLAEYSQLPCNPSYGTQAFTGSLEN
ncbi:protein shisa-4-like isoform X1 [Channa argus]|uniref:protein shisa-4-like isoform X1 n=1 Tax=Channa argus TaxID=215402 RepID=UPI00352132CA